MIKKNNSHNILFIFLLIFMFIVLLFVANSLDISYLESINYYKNFNELSILSHSFTSIVGESNLALRLPFILIYICSLYMYYLVCKQYFTVNNDIMLALFVFMLLPGVVSAGLLVNTSIIVIFSILLYVFIYFKTKKHTYLLLLFFLFLDNSFAILFIALFFYALKNKDNKLLIVSVLFFGISMQIYGFDSGGVPKGHFIDVFAIYASIYSPFVFLYFIYALYSEGVNKQQDLLWYISVTTLIFSFLLSFRQNIKIEDFAPYVVVSVPIMLKRILSSYRIKLPQFRTKEKFIIILIVVTLLINTLMVFMSKPLYNYLDNPSNHFAFKYHFAKEIASELKKRNLNEINIFNKLIRERLRFYGIKQGGTKILTLVKTKNYDEIITIKYNEKIIYVLYVTDISTFN